MRGADRDTLPTRNPQRQCATAPRAAREAVAVAAVVPLAAVVSLVAVVPLRSTNNNSGAITSNDDTGNNIDPNGKNNNLPSCAGGAG